MSHESQLDIERVRAAIHAAPANLCAPLSPETEEGLAVHLAMTLQWARAISLTSIHSLDEAIRRHVHESLFAASRVDSTAGPLLDVGSGNGYPALPIKIVHQALPTTLLEPHLRRSVFLKQVIKALKLTEAKVLRERIDRPEDLSQYAPVGTLTMRAVNAVETIVLGADSCLTPKGAVMLFIGNGAASSVRANLPNALRVDEESLLPGSRTSKLMVLRRR